MAEQRFSPEYVRVRRQGPFPGCIDPWAEVGRYFKQIHAGMIGQLLAQIQEPVMLLGYEAGRKVSLQVTEGSEPDVHVYRDMTPPAIHIWDYSLAAAEILAEPGIAVEWEDAALDAIHIRELESGDLVTIVEIVSPTNKLEKTTIAEYRERRNLFVRRGVNIMEIDPTRSVKRLLENRLATAYAYHIAVYLPQQVPRIIGVDFGESLKRVALPLRGEVVPMDLQAAYDTAYKEAAIAGQIQHDGEYTDKALPFPTLLTGQQRQDALAAVAAWQAELAHLRGQ